MAPPPPKFCGKGPPWVVVLVCGLWLALSVRLLFVVGLPPPQPTSPDPNCVFDCNGLMISSWQTGSAPYEIATGLILLISSLAALVGSSVGRAVLLIAVCGATCVAFGWEVWMIRPSPDRGVLGAIGSSWQQLLIGDVIWLVWLLWVGFSFWSLFGEKANRFYARNA